MHDIKLACTVLEVSAKHTGLFKGASSLTIHRSIDQIVALTIGYLSYSQTFDFVDVLAVQKGRVPLADSEYHPVAPRIDAQLALAADTALLPLRRVPVVVLRIILRRAVRAKSGNMSRTLTPVTGHVLATILAVIVTWALRPVLTFPSGSSYCFAELCVPLYL